MDSCGVGIATLDVGERLERLIERSLGRSESFIPRGRRGFEILADTGGIDQDATGAFSDEYLRIAGRGQLVESEIDAARGLDIGLAGAIRLFVLRSLKERLPKAD